MLAGIAWPSTGVAGDPAHGEPGTERRLRTDDRSLDRVRRSPHQNAEVSNGGLEQGLLVDVLDVARIHHAGGDDGGIVGGLDRFPAALAQLILELGGRDPGLLQEHANGFGRLPPAQEDRDHRIVFAQDLATALEMRSVDLRVERVDQVRGRGDDAVLVEEVGVEVLDELERALQRTDPAALAIPRRLVPPALVDDHELLESELDLVPRESVLRVQLGVLGEPRAQVLLDRAPRLHPRLVAQALELA